MPNVRVVARGPLRTLGWLLSIAALTYVALAGGTDDNARSRGPRSGSSVGAEPNEPVYCATGTISGAGATFPQTIVQQWIKDYGAACPGATVTYQPVGSGAGIQQFECRDPADEAGYGNQSWKLGPG